MHGDLMTLTKRSLFCKLRDAKRSLAWNGRKSWCGQQAIQEIAKIEGEFKRRGLDLPLAQEFPSGAGKNVML